MWGMGREGTMVLAPLSARFQLLPLLPTIKLVPSGADSWVGRLVHALGPCGSLQWTLLWGWAFLQLPPQPPWVFSIRGLRLYFPVLELWVAWSASLPRCSSWFIYARMWGRGVCYPPHCLPCSFYNPPVSGSSLVAPSPLHPAARLHPAYRSGWMFPFLSPWLSDFLVVRFSVSSGCFLFLNCRCPSFGCARRRSVFTYASILVFPFLWFLKGFCYLFCFSNFDLSYSFMSCMILLVCFILFWNRRLRFGFVLWSCLCVFLSSEGMLFGHFITL